MYKRDPQGTSRRGSWAAAAVAAAFLGPGTVTTCAMAGIRGGSSLLWVLLASLGALLLIQELCLRIGVAGRLSLSEGLVSELPRGLLRGGTALLVVIAIGGGAAAYQAGNLSGAATGLRSTTGLEGLSAFAIVGVAAVLVLATSRRLEVLLRVLAVLIGLMTLCFLVAAVLARPSVSELALGLLRPSLPAEGEPRANLLLVAGLVGTTIVPYNLFLHSAIVRDRTQGPEELPRERRQGALVLSLGVLVSMAVMVAAGRLHGEEDAPRRLADMSQALGSLGPWGPTVFSIGLFAAGLSSALTAPVAAGLALRPFLGDRPEAAAAVRWLVMLAGLSCGLIWGSTPGQLILLAQVSNALMLPIALALSWWLARRARLGSHRSGPLVSLLGAVVVALGVLLAVRTALALWG